MPTLRTSSYAAASGRVCSWPPRYPGPAWTSSRARLAWFQLPLTAGIGGPSLPAHVFSGGYFARKAGKLRFGAVATGGHQDSGVDAGAYIDLNEDAPTLVINQVASSVSDPGPNAPYNLGNKKPASRHSYWSNRYLSPLGKVFLFGCLYPWGPNATAQTVDAFDPLVNPIVWDGIVPGQPGVSGSGHEDVLANAYAIAVDDAAGKVWMISGFKLYMRDCVARTQLEVKDFNAGQFAAPAIWDPVRSQILSIGFGNGADNSAQLNAFRIVSDGLPYPNNAGTVATQLTLGGPGYSTFVSEVGKHASMVHRASNDSFLWMGDYAVAGRVYALTFTGADTMNVEIVATTGTPPNVCLNGNGRFTKTAIVGGAVDGWDDEFFVVMDTTAGANFSCFQL